MDLPDIGESIKKGDTLVAYETIKAVSQVSLPFDTKIIEVNDKLWEDPNIINDDPYNEWIIKIEGKFSEHLLMDVKEAVEYYKKLIAKERKRFAGS